MGTMRDHDHIDTLHQQLLSVGGELERLGHEHIVITVLQDQPSVFSSGKGKVYLEGHWQFVTDFVSFCGGHECLKSELLGVDDNVTSEDVAKTDKAKCSTQPNYSRDNNDVVCTTEGYKHDNKYAKAVNDSSNRDTGLKDNTEEGISVMFDESDNEDFLTEDSATSPHMGEPGEGGEQKTENSNKTTSSCRSEDKITKPGGNTSRKRKHNLKSAKLQRNNVVIDDKRKLNNGSKTVRIKRNKATDRKTGVDRNVVEGYEEKFAYEHCPEKLELQDLDNSNLDNHDDLACSICKKQFDVASELTAHNQEHIDNEGCLACQLCDNRLFKVEWQLGEHIERDHNKSSNMREGHFPCCECGYIFKYQNHLDEHQQVLPDCKNVKPAKEKEKELLDSVANLPDPKSDKIKTKTWRDLFSRSKYPAKCDLCGKSFKIRFL